jgi:hypothetical protein
MRYDRSLFTTVPLPLHEKTSLEKAPENPKPERVYRTPTWTTVLSLPKKERHKAKPQTKSGYRGVIFAPYNLSKPWKAYMTHQGQYLTLGYFETKELAAARYNEMALRIHGPETYVNPV